MLRNEMSREDAIRITAGYIRNMATTATIFTPYIGLDLCVRDGMLCRTDTGTSHFERGYTPIASMDELLVLSDEEMFCRVTGEKL